MDSEQILEEIKKLSRDRIERILKSVRKAEQDKLKKKRVVFAVKVDRKKYPPTTNGNDIIKEFMKDLVPNIAIMSPYAIKTQIVSLFEMLAEAEDCPSQARKWRLKASKVVMLTNQKALFSYVTNIATGINMTKGGYAS